MGELRTEFTSPLVKSTSPMLSDMTFFARWYPSSEREGRIYCLVILILRKNKIWSCRNGKEMLPSLWQFRKVPTVGDMWAIYQWSAGQSIGRLSTDYRRIDCGSRGLPTYCSRLDQLSTDIGTDMLIDSQPRYWSILRSTLPKRCMILFNYPLASMFMECLPTQWLAWWCLYQPTG